MKQDQKHDLFHLTVQLNNFYNFQIDSMDQNCKIDLKN